jgi:1-acyl-sn-glycerol-3-phosphate acyltransferase
VPRRDDGDLNIWWRIGLAIVTPIVWLLFKLRVSGAERVPAGSAVVAANHVSALDGVLLSVATGNQAHRMTRFLVAAEFFEKRRFGWALRLYRQIPLRRGEGDSEALEEAVRTVKGGALAGIFPEGRVNPDPEAGLLRGHTGVARIALEAEAPVVPVGIWGTQRRWPHRGLRWGRPFRPVVAIVYGAPLPPSGDGTVAADVQGFTSDVMEAIAAEVDVAREAARGDRSQVGEEPR